MEEMTYKCPECDEILEQGDYEYNYDYGDLFMCECHCCGCDHGKPVPREKNKYRVTLYYHTCATVEVEAYSEEEAIENAENEDINAQLMDSMQEDGAADVERID